MSLRIALDCDGCIADLDSALAEIATRLFGEPPQAGTEIAGLKPRATAEAGPTTEPEATTGSGATTEPGATPKPGAAPGSSATPEPGATPKADATPGPGATPGSDPTPGSGAAPKPVAAPDTRATADADEGPSPEEEQVEPARYRALTRRQQHDLWEAVRKTENFWETLNETEPGIIARLAQVARERRWEVIFITQRPSSAGDITQLQTQRWLVAHGYEMPNVYVIKGTRGKVAEALSLDVVVDDRPEHCLDVKLESRARAILIGNGDPASVPPNARKLGIEPVAGIGACLDLLTAPPSPRPGLLSRFKKLVGA